MATQQSISYSLASSKVSSLILIRTQCPQATAQNELVLG